MKKKTLFITKKYPPAIGGEHQFCFDLFQNLKGRTDIDLYAKEKGSLTLFYITAFCSALIKASQYHTFLFSGGSLAPVGILLKFFTRRRIVIVIHGQDIVGKKKHYQKLIPRLVAKFDKVIAVSENTKRLCIKRGISPEKITVIPNGIDFKNRDTSVMERGDWQKKFHIDPSKKTLITVGRLAPHKGVSEFIADVLPKLPRSDYQYFVIGKGGRQRGIETAIASGNLSANVFMTGELSVVEKNSFWKYADLMIMPNIVIPETPEGFGIVAIESASWGLPVLACSVDGIPDAILTGVSGILAENQNELGKALAKFLEGELNFSDRNNIASAIRERYDWNKLAEKYLDLLR